MSRLNLIVESLLKDIIEAQHAANLSLIHI